MSFQIFRFPHLDRHYTSSHSEDDDHGEDDVQLVQQLLRGQHFILRETLEKGKALSKKSLYVISYKTRNRSIIYI